MILAHTVHELHRCSEAIGCGIFDRFLNFDDCQTEAASDVISGTVDHDVGVDVRANFGYPRLKPSEVSFSALLRTSITSDRKYIVTSYPVQL